MRWWTVVEDEEFLRYARCRPQWGEEQRAAEQDAIHQRLRGLGHIESEVDGR